MRTIHILALAALVGWLIEQAFWWPVRRDWRSGVHPGTWYHRYMPPASGLTSEGQALRHRASIASILVILAMLVVFLALPVLQRIRS